MKLEVHTLGGSISSVLFVAYNCLRLLQIRYVKTDLFLISAAATRRWEINIFINLSVVNLSPAKKLSNEFVLTMR
jgi:hypothetical protein